MYYIYIYTYNICFLVLKEWGNPTEQASWRLGGPGPSPYKNHFTPLRQIPGNDEPQAILWDFCHIVHLGYGMDITGSSLVLLCNLGHFGGERSLETRLSEAFCRFDMWCKSNQRTSSIDEFSKQSLGMGKCPSLTNFSLEHTPTFIF